MFKFMIAALIAFFSSGTVNARDNEEKAFLDFFSKAIRIDQLRANDIVWRWPENIVTCIFGDYNAYDSKLVSDNIKLLNAASNLNLQLFFNRAVDGCPNNTLLYMRFHRKNLQARQLIWDDLHAVDSQKRRDTDTPLSKISELGAIVYTYGGSAPPYIFIAARSSSSDLAPQLDETTDELVQKSLYLAITSIPDQFKLREFPSFLRDSISTVVDDAGTLFERSNRRRNLCELDLMFLIALYAPSGNLLSPLEYKSYIQDNYNYIKNKTEKIYHSGAYNHIIKNKC